MSRSSQSAAEAVLDVRGLDAFYGRAQVLAGVSLTVNRGEVVVLLGRNGAGKSTTMKAIMGLVTRGSDTRIVFRGERIEHLAPFRIARMGLGYVPEDRRIFTGLTVRENLEVGRQPARAGIPGWDWTGVVDLFPNLGAMADRPGGRMSGGEQQMLTIARTLMGNPACILLDEPSEGVAPVIVDQMADALERLKRAGVSILLSEQNLHFARRIADTACIIESGRIRYRGALSELEADERTRDQYLAL
jgi:branched-chain amino acid transport system ATP-binding protein